MEIRVLRYFLAVAREGSVTRAAEALHLTQPTLSRQLAQLEADLGVRLFERGARRITLTPQGVLFRRRAEQIVELADKAQRELAEREAEVAGTVSIGCGDLEAVGLLARLLAAFGEHHPQVTFDLYTGTADHIQQRMDRGLTDVGLLLEPADLSACEFVRLDVREEFVVVMRPDAALARLDRVTPEDLRGVPLIMPRRLGVRSELANWFGAGYDALDVRFTTNLNTTSNVLVDAGLGCAVAVRGSLPLWDGGRLTCRPLDPPLVVGSVLAWRRDQPLGPATRRFVAFVRDELARQGAVPRPS